MPRLDIDMFDDAPKIGDKVKVLGKVESIDEDSGEVEITYDKASIVKKKKKSSRRNNDDDDDDDDDDVDIVYTNEQMPPPESQSLDSALARAFPNTQ